MSGKKAGVVFLLALTIPLALAYLVEVANQIVVAYRWFLIVHLFSLFTFMLSHGASALLAFRVRSVPDGEKVRLYISLARDPIVVLSMGATLALVLSTGISLGFFTNAWGKGWIWAVLGTAVFITFAMSFTGRRFLDKTLAGLQSGSRQSSVLPEAAAAVGFAGLLLILYLILFKPF